jgi:hypothetical protein
MTVDIITECPCVIPVQLPCCKNTVDIYSLSQVETCPFDRKKLNHRLLQTNLNLSPKITFYFYQSKLRFSSVQLSEKEWQRAEFTFDWLSKNVPPAFQQRLKIQTVFHCVLEWSAVEQKYLFTASSQNMELQLTPLFDLRIPQDWAQNFAGKYFSLLRS